MKARMRSLLYDTACVADANEYVACSESAGKSVFGNKPFAIITNAMNTSQYHFDPDARMQLRKSLEIENKFVVGHVGRFFKQKNHQFLIEIFKEIQTKKENAILLLVGTGELKEEIQNQVKELGLEEQVRFLGVRSDVDQIMKCFDVFLFPSLF